MARAQALGALRLAAKQLLDVDAHLLVGGWPAVRADAPVDGRELDRSPLVRRLIDREAQLQRPRRDLGIEIRRLPGQQRIDEGGRGTTEGAVVGRVELGEGRLATVFLV